MKKKLSIVIISYNVKYYLEQCLTALLWIMKDVDGEVIVVDNHSKDGTVEYLKGKYGAQITLVASNHNLGFATANNVALRHATGEYILLLNPDTIPTRSSLLDTIAFLDCHERAGGLGVRMLKADGTNALESRRGLPTPMTAFYKMCGLCSRYPSHPRFGHYYMSNMPWERPARIEVVSGAFFMIRRAALDAVGTLDEDFFMYGEDIDMSYRLLQAGYENWYYPSTILHYKGESTYKSSFRYVHVFYKAMLIFFRKHYGHLSFLVTLPIQLAIVSRAAMTVCKIEWDGWRRQLGLKRRRGDSQPMYVFIGTPYTLSQCRRIAKHKGLDATFIEGTIGSLPDGHTQIALPSHRPLVVVYDVHAYSFNDIFRIFSLRPQGQVTIGTYDNTSQIIITETEIICDGV